MSRSTALQQILANLNRRADELGMTRTEWARRAGLPKETLSRLQHRSNCDFETLRALAAAVDERLGLADDHSPRQGHFPVAVDRDYEERLLELCASNDLDFQAWSNAGPWFFMAGLAVMVASDAKANRRRLIELAEELHPGISETGTFTRWLERTPLRPSRFFPMLEAQRLRLARQLSKISPTRDAHAA